MSLLVPFRTLPSHIEEQAYSYLEKDKSLHPVLLELHDLGLLFIVDSSSRESSSVVLEHV